MPCNRIIIPIDSCKQQRVCVLSAGAAALLADAPMPAFAPEFVLRARTENDDALEQQARALIDTLKRQEIAARKAAAVQGGTPATEASAQVRMYPFCVLILSSYGGVCKTVTW